MNVLVALISFSFFVLTVTSVQYCEPADEFVQDETTTEWDNFMDKISELTFDKTYTNPCKTNTSQNVVIDAKSDFLWNLRFTVYNERQKTEEKTIEQCYKTALNQSGDEICDTSIFKGCMKEARRSMFEEIVSSWWGQRIDEELKNLADDC